MVLYVPIADPTRASIFASHPHLHEGHNHHVIIFESDLHGGRTVVYMQRLNVCHPITGRSMPREVKTIIHEIPQRLLKEISNTSLSVQ